MFGWKKALRYTAAMCCGIYFSRYYHTEWDKVVLVGAWMFIPYYLHREAGWE